MYNIDIIKLITNYKLDFFLGMALIHILNGKNNIKEIKNAIFLLEQKINNINNDDKLDNLISFKIKKNNIDFYFINLEKRVDRLSHIQSELKKYNIDAKRFNAFDNIDNCHDAN